jgi:hypothetical protein
MYKLPMYKMIAAMLTCALLTTLTVVDAQDKPSEHKGKTQGEISRERGQACEGLKGQAMQECLDNYVGPSRDLSSETEDAGDSKKANAVDDKKAQDAAGSTSEDSAAKVDMTKSNKRGPVGPMRDQADDMKK